MADQLYRYTYQWEDGHPDTVIVGPSSWLSQNLAYCERFGLGNEATAKLVSVEISEIND